MKRFLFLLLMACLSVQVGFAQSSEVAAAVKQINAIKSDSKYLYAESTTKDWEQAYEDAKALLLAEIDNWVKNQGKKGNDVKGYVAKIENNFMEVKTRRGNLFRVFVYIKKKDIITYTEDVEITVNSLKPSAQSSESVTTEKELNETLASSVESVDSVAGIEETDSQVEEMEENKVVRSGEDEKFLALKESSNIQSFLKEHASKFGKISEMPKQQDCYVMLFSEDAVEKYFKHQADEDKVLNLESMEYEDLNDYQGLGYRGIWFIMK